MVPELRRDFNERYTPEHYRTLISRLTDAARTRIEFRLAETPCFFTQSMLDAIAQAGSELTHQLLRNPDYLERSSAAVPERFRVPQDSPHPHFMTADFGLVREEDGTLTPRLVELQAFPSIYGMQSVIAREYVDAFELDPALQWFLGGHDEDSYWKLLEQVIVGDHDPENVILLEVEPAAQKTLSDFNVTEDRLGIRAVDIATLVKQGNRLFYPHQGSLVPIHRIYNRAIVDEIVRKNIQLPFDYRDDLDVEWAGHPNWYFRISKFSIPYLEHPSVPPAVFLDDWFAGKGRDRLPQDREQWIFKPLYSFAGKGIQFAPTDEDLASIPADERHNYLLQERVQFASVIETPHGPTQPEIRILYVWPDGEELQPLLSLLRLGRGLMMGVDHNRDREWVGASAGLFFPGT
jgi:hypothetical protein